MSTRSSSSTIDSPGCLLRAEGLCHGFGEQRVLDGVNLELRRGDAVLLTGANGSGKTTLLNILTGHLIPDAGRITVSGHPVQSFDGGPRRLSRLLSRNRLTPEAAVKAGLGRSWQASRLFVSQSLRDNVAVAMPRQPGEYLWAALLGVGRPREQSVLREADALLARLGLSHRAQAHASQVSLGQAKRAAIARAVAAGARVLFLDEPFAGLDSAGIAESLSLLRALVADHGVALVIVEHALHHHRLDGLVTRHWELDRGSLRRTSRTSDAAPPILGVPPDTDGIPAWLAAAFGEAFEVHQQPLPRGARFTRLRPRHGSPAIPLLTVEDLVVRRGERVVVGLDDAGAAAGLSLELHEGEVGVLSAPNGWGKSTLFESLAGLTPIERGRIGLRGQQVQEWPACERVRAGLRPVAADPRLFPGLSTRDVLQLAGAPARAASYATLGVRLSGSLSGGERQALALDAASAGLVGLFDEPVGGLDRDQMAALRERAAWRGTRAQLILLPG